MSIWNSHKRSETTDSGLTITQIPEDEPKFCRTYKVTLDDRAVLEVTIKKVSYGLSKHGELTQPNGNQVWFDPDRIADRILDPALVPKIRERVEEIYTIDRAWRSNGPFDYIDERGARWQRAA